ncbi:hypothetical protein ERO13_A06G022350v2 [Gossypium hirsutum]|uniref:Uncharacterized protein n=5 Tax=Gossypium TaxID=3633 RepID=A0ABR0PHU3_GOSAR|nr:hypothetical protein ES319_A06G024800v1 [Gossypium barbadense]KAG4193906.1 hypothetical protein ERO13_A06G022350v2 [Gossypium hirsutum]KAK5823985.1 hypothetical protein PVK06_018748 [Gossypium arboreum]TYH11932.1 hypothetical protein ES288_A06G025600v1 [Gossypium darwinii]TYI21249.1 hypothetical protein ES332_A06G024900v1 [Gossypium tomentosum]TYJ28782.1 hypothetical protein E1A91_A06G024000v1 [Gossypium mustelinum]
MLRLLRILMVVMLLSSMLISADPKDEPLLVGTTTNAHSPVSNEKIPMDKQQQPQSLRGSFGVFFSSKRKVPNAADPLHNR